MKKSLFTLTFILTGTLLFAQYDPKALEILEAMSAKYKSLTSFEANLTSSLTNDTDGIHEEFKGKITVKGDKFKLLVDDQEIINNGTTVWTYLPSASEVNIDNADPDSDEMNPSKFYVMYKKGYKYLYLEDQMDGGVLCEVVDLVPEKKDAQYFKIRMNIAKKDKSIQSWVMFDKSGNRYKYSISKFVPNVKVDDSFFTFDPKKYPGVEVIDLR
ncbi:MAG TPA: outer membrane lipoprotein carrier protein LolA [Cyclobacteriaceae bacterium]|jgi:outer membrane lipoprotein-sorting protein|nr:outer membrane lipoprotein carrier protein LolA [Cyclobacteriaceae bacterium]HNP07948.1 outer membrane lipoprotein carrier protein LolA [Cyclobacteriaceae bacterium]HRK53543.1 outer membrane lipoprotein carrier protein LolA [Cyclobacteriaceae bacterium]